ncbi:HTH-type transcriptional activator IlvY [Serratia symbiotica]|nr:HTH-type transcriptional activator IlvY [Serratia symbiotica]
MDLRDLKLFLHLADSHHFGRTAKAMHVSPSTLSRQIQRLEAILGQPLFLRDNRTVKLTDAGEQLKQFAQQTLLQYQQLKHALGQHGSSLSGELRLFCSVTAAYSHLPPILDHFRAQHPLVEIKLTTGDAADAVDKVQSSEADLGIVGGHEAIVSMVALGCGIALIPSVVVDNSPEPVRQRISPLENVSMVAPFELGVCVQKKRLSDPLINAFWRLLPP